MIRSRTRVLIVNAVGGGGARAINLLLAAIFVPLAIKMLGVDGYGVAAAAISFATLAAYADLGLGASVVNAIAASDATGENEAILRAQTIVSNVWYLLLTIGAAVALCALIASQNLGNLTASVSTFAFSIVGIGLPFGLYQRILFAQQKNLQANIWQSAGKIVAVGLIWIISLDGRGTPYEFVFAMLGAPVVIDMLGTLATFLKADSRSLRPNKVLVNSIEIRLATRLGLSFSLLQMVPFVEVGMDNAALAWIKGPGLIASYDIYKRLFLYVPALISIGMVPLWPAISKAIAENDMGWVRKIRKWCYSLTIFGTIAVTSILFSISGRLVHAWSGSKLLIDRNVLVGMAFFAVIASVSMVQSMLLNGHGYIRQQARIYFIYMGILVAMKVLVLATLGVAAMVWSTVAASCVRLVVIERCSRNWRESHAEPSSNG